MSRIKSLAFASLLLLTTSGWAVDTDSQALLTGNTPVTVANNLDQPMLKLQPQDEASSSNGGATVTHEISTARGFDASTLVCLGFGIAGLLWVRRRSAAL